MKVAAVGGTLAGMCLVLAAGLGPCGPEVERGIPVGPAAEPADPSVSGAPDAATLQRASADQGEAVERDAVPDLAQEGTHQVAVTVSIDHRWKLERAAKVELGWSFRADAKQRGIDRDPVLVVELLRGEAKVFQLEAPVGAGLIWGRVAEPGIAEVKGYDVLESGGAMHKISLRALAGATARGTLETASGEMPPRFRMSLFSTSVESLETTLREMRSRGRIGLSSASPKYLAGRLQGDGRFELHFRGAGPARLDLHAYENGGGSLELPVLDEANPPQDLRAVLVAGDVLGGVLSDEKGRALAGTEVVVVGWNCVPNLISSSGRLNRLALGVSSEGRLGVFCVTDADGRFLAEGLGPQQLVVLAHDDGSTRWRALHKDSLEAGGRHNQFVVRGARLSVRLRMPEGGYAKFDPTQETKVLGKEGGLRSLASAQRVSILPLIGQSEAPGKWDFSESGPPPVSPYMRARTAIAWFDTGDPTRWEIHLAPGVEYELHAMSRERQGAARRVSLAATESMREVELLLSPAREPGKLELTVVDPPGTRGVYLYNVEIRPEQGEYLKIRQKVSKTEGAEQFPIVIQLELPPGRYECVVKPWAQAWYGTSSSGENRAIIPGEGSVWVDVVSGGQHASTVETTIRGEVEVRIRAEMPDLVLVAREHGSGLELTREKVLSGPEYEPFNEVHLELPVGRIRLEALIGLDSFSKVIEIEYGDQQVHQLGPGGWNRSE
ncbi:MAG: hypothetical protein ACI8QC_000094 [Planctomycetota bacterium]|jgi:hypothetical protein